MGTMRERGLLLIALTVACISTTFVVGLLKPVSMISLSSTVQGINVQLYSDSECTRPIDQIDWGLCIPGTNVTKTVYIMNTDSKAISLTLRRVSKASMTHIDDITVVWDQEGATLPAGEILSTTLFISIPETLNKLSEIYCDFTVVGEN
jgi:hypothetical protein